MGFRKLVRDFFRVAGKSLRFRYYIELGERPVGVAFRYFLSLLLASFLIMGLAMVPTVLTVAGNLEQNALAIGHLRFSAALSTEEPVMIPQTNPLITLDSTGEREMETERFLITDKEIFFNLRNQNESIVYSEYDFANSREVSLDVFRFLSLLLIPGLFVLYFLIYLVKYLLILIPFAILTYVIARMAKSQVTFKQSISLVFYAATSLVAIEILTIPFRLQRIFWIKSLFMGVNFSMVGLCLFLIYYVTAIRLNGNRYIRR